MERPAAQSTDRASTVTHWFIRRELTPPQFTNDRWLGTILVVGW